MTAAEAAAALGLSEAGVLAIARGRKLKGEAAPLAPMHYTIEQRRFVEPQGARFRALTRTELYADGRLIYAVEHSPGLFGTADEAERVLRRTDSSCR